MAGRIFAALDNWCLDTGLGRAAFGPGIIFTDEDNVIPDVVWASNERLDRLLDEAEHLTGAPELVVGSRTSPMGSFQGRIKIFGHSFCSLNVPYFSGQNQGNLDKKELTTSTKWFSKSLEITGL